VFVQFLLAVRLKFPFELKLTDIDISILTVTLESRVFVLQLSIRNGVQVQLRRLRPGVRQQFIELRSDRVATSSPNDEASFDVPIGCMP
jgi:hypothetical protein